MRRKLFYILLDGVGDRPDPSLNGLTPLEAAQTPNLDELARRSVSGLVYTVGKGVSPESDVAVFSMLGYEVLEGYAGRGVVEAVGVGLKFKDGDLALRANFATLGDGLKVVDRRAGRDLTDEEAEALSEAIRREVKLSKGVSYQFKHTVAHRASLVIRAKDVSLSADISNLDPGYERVAGMGVARAVSGEMRLEWCRPLDDRPESRLSASLVNEFVRKCIEVLEKHPVNEARRRAGKLPANLILIRDAGNSVPKLKPLDERFGLRFACILDMPVEKGVARLTGMDDYRAGGVEDYEEKAEKAVTLFESYDVVYVHLKGPDEPGHDGKAWLKKKVIEDIDKRFFGRLLKWEGIEELVVVVSSDHSTPCSLKSHSDDPVPLIISSPSVKKDGTCRFTENEAAKGSLGVMRGVEVLSKAVSLLSS